MESNLREPSRTSPETLGPAHGLPKKPCVIKPASTCRLVRSARTFAATITLLLASPSAHAAEKPNILFILSDDQSYEMIRTFGHTDIDTPKLEAIFPDLN